MEMPFNILEMLPYFHYFYSQLLFRQYKDHRMSVPIELFSFFWKFERPVTLRTRLTRKFCLRSFITLIYGYSFQFWINKSTRRRLINRGMLFNFRVFSDPLELITICVRKPKVSGSSTYIPRLLWILLWKYVTTLLLFEHSLFLTGGWKEFALFEPILPPFLALNEACKCLSIYETSSWTLSAFSFFYFPFFLQTYCDRRVFMHRIYLAFSLVIRCF